MDEKTYSVLVVEDESAVGTVIETALGMQALDVVLVESGEAALEQLKQRSFDLVLSDMKMPGISGVELFEIITREYPSIRRVLNSGDPGQARDYITNGVIHRLIAKPWRVKELIDIIAEEIGVTRDQGFSK